MPSKKKRNKRKSRKTAKSDVASPKKGGSKTVSSAQPKPLLEIRRLISKGKIKSAVNKAKQYHKAEGTGASEGILVEAYVARILEMNEKGLAIEADTLLNMVRERYPLPAALLAEITTAAAACRGVNDEFLAPLDNPATPPEQQMAILNKIKEKVAHLTVLTDCGTLSPHHPLKVQATALDKAFQAVTSGPVLEKEIALPEISRKSPLAPWKMLIKALFFFYRHEDAPCERSLKAVETGSAPARLVPVIRAMLRKNTFGKPGVLDSVLDAGKSMKLSSAIRSATSLIKQLRPELLEELKRRISIRSWMMDADKKRITKAMGGASLKDAHFWNLIARAAEIKGKHFLACAMWDEFIKHALHEKMLSPDSLEISVIYFHMANLLSETADPDFEWRRSQFEPDFWQSKGFSSHYQDQPKFITRALGKHKKTDRHPYFLYPERLYERVCKIDPSFEAFSNWLEWMQKGDFKKKSADAVAVKWHQAIPHDIPPVLHLAESAEKRNAFKKCLTYLDEAEHINALHPSIRKIRVRILTATAIRHLKQKKPHLAKKDFREMESLPLFQVGNRPAFLTALKWVCVQIESSAPIESNAPKLRGLHDELVKSMGSQLSAAMILWELLKACGLPQNASGAAYAPLEGLEIDDLPSHVGRVCLLGEDVGFPIAIPPFYVEELEDAFSEGTPGLDAPAIRSVGEAALRDDCPELAHAVSVAGLLKGGTTVAGFLLLRARSLPSRARFRKINCINAAIALAQRERDMDLIAEAVELRRKTDGADYHSIFPGRQVGTDFSTDPEALANFLEKEKADREYPYDDDGYDGDGYDGDEDFSAHECRSCDKKNCRDRKSEYMPDFDDDEWDDEDEDLLDELLDGVFPEIEEMFKKDPKLLEAFLEELPDDQPFFGPGKKKKKKGRR
ncbi:MAG: hypothetical protein B6240_10650 [Desulfobacteraceae bacterium 4572_87]|nr:MAG: hypothetical protein B6240_10650 [Desulfobacteraceae bacterium 4572_87]